MLISLFCILSSFVQPSCLTAAEVLPGVAVGTYLYADPQKLPPTTGGFCLTLPDLTLHEGMLPIAYGRKFRKDRTDRDGSTEAERERFKPFRGKLSADRKIIIFSPLPIDLYDVILVDRKNMIVYEGVALNKLGNNPDLPRKQADQFRSEIEKTLFPPPGKIGGWEGFFDRKEISRIEMLDETAAIFLQQMRHGKALAESGATLQGCIHSLDVVWLERSRKGIAGWKVLNRQQLYREEITSREFFRHHFVRGFQGIRAGSTLRHRQITVNSAKQ